MSLPIIPGFASLEERKTIIVNTNLDTDPRELKKDGLTSLRSALQQAQKSRGPWSIVFEAKENQSTGNNLRLNYWTIQLKDPLIVERGDIAINQVNPQNITLVPEGTKSSETRGREITGLLVQSGPDYNRARLQINRVNFANFTAKGGNAEEGGGGGGGRRRSSQSEKDKPMRRRSTERR